MSSPQETLEKLWHRSAPGSLTPWETVRALGLRDACRELHGGNACVTWIASRLRKTDSTGKSYSADHPAQSSVSELFQKIDADPMWFPGKRIGAKRGRKPLLTQRKRARIASSAMSQKVDGNEPSVEVTILRCPVATLNPETQLPFCDKVIRKVFLEDCYDFDPEQPWKLQLPLQRFFLPDAAKAHRLAMARRILDVQDHGDSVQWWARNVVWIDPCASILPRTRRHYNRMRQAELGNKKRYISDDAREYSRNLRGKKETLKQDGYEATRISWLIVVARGAVAVEMLPPDWTVDGAGMAAAVQQVPGILRRMLGDTALLPRILFTDRGTGMYAPNGKVTHAYSHAVDASGLRLYWGEDAKLQAPDMGDMLLHETAVS